jgi:(R,R)-butanediol dehydrogenase / meso-butanediol dehydrogenase / diacetyl reductase
MKAINLYGAGDVRIDEIDMPRARENEVVVKVGACGICGTDLTFVKHGSMRGNEPMRLGHEASGVVTEVGKGVRAVAPGMRVAINPMGEIPNIIGNGGTEGAFAEYLLVRGAELGRNLFAVPDGVPFSIAAMAEPLAVALHGVNRTGAKAGEKVVVFGAGPIGIGAVIWLKEKGIDNIVVVDLAPERLQNARRFGARTIVLAGKDDLRQVLTKVHGRETVFGIMPCVGSDVYIDMAGASSIVSDVIALAKAHARLVITAAYRESVPVNFGLMLSKEITITTAVGYPDEFGKAVDLLVRNPSIYDAYISHRYPLSQFHEALKTAAMRSAAKVVIEFYK